MTVTAVNDAPVPTNGSLTTAEDTAGTMNLTSLITDVDGAVNPAHITVGGASNGSVAYDNTTGIATFTPAANYNGAASFTYTIDDGTGPLTRTVNVTVTAVDDAPTLTNNGVTVNEGSTTVLTSGMLDTSDVDTADGSLVYTVGTVPANGTITVNGGPALTNGQTFTQSQLDAGQVRYIHDGSETVSDSFAFSVSDGNTDLTGNTFSITVSPVNDAPSTAGGSLTVAEDGSQTIDLNTLITDAEGIDYTSHVTLSVPGNGTAVLNTATGVVTYTPDANYNGADSFTYTVNDGTGDQTQTITVTVTAVNDAPVIATNTGANVEEGSTVIITNVMLSSTDIDNGSAALTYTASNYLNGQIEVGGNVQNTFTQADIDNGVVVFRHDGTSTITARFDVSVSDGALTDTATFNMTVADVNDAPVITTNLGGTVIEDANITITSAMLEATDSDDVAGDLNWTVQSIEHGHLELNTNPGVVISTFTQADIDNGLVDYIHHGGEASTAQISLSVADNGDDGALPANGMFTLNVTPVNDAPTGVMLSSYSVAEDMSVGSNVATLTTMDVDLPGDSFTYTLMSNPNALFSIVGNALMLSSSLDFETLQSETVMIRTDDGNGGIFDQMITINITDINEQNFVPTNEADTEDSGPSGINTEPVELAETSERSEFIIRSYLSDIVKSQNSGGQRVFGALSIGSRGFIEPESTRADYTLSRFADTNERQKEQGIFESDADDGGLQQPNIAALNEKNTGTPHEISSLQDALDFFTKIETIQDYIDGKDISENSSDRLDNTPSEEVERSIIKRLSIEDQFEDVLTYQIQRQELLKTALLDKASE